jgi:predicted  nucleic acid-binding Zn-ribbon protein
VTTQVRLDALLELQSIDMQIAELAKRQDEIPPRRAEVVHDITALETEKREREEAVERARLDRRGREGELETENGRRERYERQLNDVKTNVAYSALLTEIQGAKRRIGEIEEEILALMELREEHEKRLAEIASDLAGKRSAAAAELKALTAEEADLEGKLVERRASRDAVAAEVDDRFLQLYDRLRRGNRFPALVPLRGQACGACHGRLPPQIVREITHDGTLHPCEGCGVLVYAEPVSGARPADAD